MNNTNLTIWCNNDFGPADQREVSLLTNGVGEHELLMFGENDSSAQAIRALNAADIAFGYPAPDDVLASPSLRWTQLNSGGYTSYDHEEIKRQLVAKNVVLTNSSAVFDEPCAQHLLAMIMSLRGSCPQLLMRNVVTEHGRWMLSVLHHDYLMARPY